MRLLAAVAALAMLAVACDTGTTNDTETEPAPGEETEDTEAIDDTDATDDTTEGEEEVTGDPEGDLVIGLVTINLQALFFNQINQGAEQVAEELGAELRIFNANNDPVEQNNAIESYVQDGVDALIVLAIDTEGIVPAIEAADEAGVPVVAVDAIVDSPAVSSQVGTDNEGAGRQIGEFLLDVTGGEGEVGIVGALNSTIQNIRQRGFEDAVTEGGMTITNVVDGRNVQEDALTAAENLITGNPDMAYTYATGEPALIGLVSAVESQGAEDRVQAVGWDLSAPALEGIEAGYVIGVVQQDTFRFGEEGMRAAAALARGEEVDAEIPIDTFIVTPDNVDDYRYFLED
jgi:ribose transport system substrate-binding protein